jgi:RNA polymerase sigma-70 factor (ECF subfamily)
LLLHRPRPRLVRALGEPERPDHSPATVAGGLRGVVPVPDPKEREPRTGSPNPRPLPLTDRDDATLARAAGQGDEASFRTLIERYERLLFKIALRKAGNRADAEDIVQDVCMHAWRSLAKIRDPQAFLGWLMAIAHNRANRYCDRRRRKVVVLDEARRTLEERARARAERAEADEDGGELVRRLPDEMRLALSWKYLDGCSYEEIGERLDMSFHQVDYLLRRAKAALRREVERVERSGEEGLA